MADITGKEVKVIGKGKVACMVFGNRFTQDQANHGVKNVKGKIGAGAVEAILADISCMTPSSVLSTVFFPRMCSIPTLMQRFSMLSKRIAGSADGGYAISSDPGRWRWQSPG